MPLSPDPLARYPVPSQPSRVFLKSIIANPQIDVGSAIPELDLDPGAGSRPRPRLR